ncbi:MAG: fumarylacetoacetate hydrolase family protein [Planctomycetota bacterium]
MSPSEVSRAGSTARVFRVPSSSGSSLILEHGGGHFDLSYGFDHARHGDLLELVSRGFFDHLPKLGEAARAHRRPVAAPVEVLTPFEPRQVGKVLALTRPPSELFERQAAGDCSRWFDNRSPHTLAADRAMVTVGDSEGAFEAVQVDPSVLFHQLFLAVVISRRASGLEVADAMSSIAGYTMASDFTRRSLDGRPRTPWFGESPAGTLVIGPAFVPSSAFDLRDVQVRAQRKRGGVSDPQVTSCADFTPDVTLAVAALSRLAILHPGDLVLVPAGQGQGVVEGGDEVRCAIEGIGELSNSVRRRARLRLQA